MKKVALIEMNVRAFIVYDVGAPYAPADAVAEFTKERLGRDVESVDYRVLRMGGSMVAGMSDEVALGYGGKTVKQVIEEG